MSVTVSGVVGGVTSLHTVISKVMDVMSGRSPSLPEHARNALIMSSVYTEQVVMDEAIYPHIISMIHQIYGAYVLTALGLSDQIGGCTVRNLLKTISTESFIEGVELVNCYFDSPDLDKPIISMEASSASVDIDSQQQRAAAGKIIEVNFKVNKNEIKIYLYLQLNPVGLTPDTAEAFITLNFPDSMYRRWQRMKSGEISFFKDFLLCQYEVKKMDEALRKDNTGSLTNMLINRSKSIVKAWLNLVGIRPNHNAASSILIISKETFDRVCKQERVDFSKSDDRDRFFGKSMMMMVLVVDNNFALVDIYTHGLSTYGTHSFKSIEKASGNNLDMKDLMALMSRGSAPRF